MPLEPEEPESEGEEEPPNAAEIEKTLDRLYNDPKSPAAFAGVNRLLEEARKVLGRGKVKKKDVEHYLSGHRTYTLMRPRRVRFPRNRTIAAGYMTDLQADLADLKALAEDNNGYSYILVAIDVLSKRVFGVPIKSKERKDVVPAFKKLLNTMPQKPHRIFSDKGGEFKSAQLSKLLKEEEIEKYTANSISIKASIVERAIRNIKQRLYRYFAEKQTKKWIDVLQKILDGINHSKSRTHGLRPVDVTPENAQEVWERLYGDLQLGNVVAGHFKRRKKAKLKKDDYVRMSRDKGKFEKGYLPNWGDEILEVDVVKDKAPGPVRYRLRDEKGNASRRLIMRRN